MLVPSESKVFFQSSIIESPTAGIRSIVLTVTSKSLQTSVINMDSKSSQSFSIKHDFNKVVVVILILSSFFLAFKKHIKKIVRVSVINMGGFSSVSSKNGGRGQAAVYIAPFSSVKINHKCWDVSVTRYAIEYGGENKSFVLPNIEQYVLVYGKDWICLGIILFLSGVAVGYFLLK